MPTDCFFPSDEQFKRDEMLHSGCVTVVRLANGNAAD
jgi:hypothetical protein